MSIKKYDIYIVGVGGQGVLTIADILTSVAFTREMPVNYYPTKGMAQRGGFVKVQLRFGRSNVGPDIPQNSADLVISMERSESLKAVKYLKKGGEFFLYDNCWEPTAVMLGKAPYPTLKEVWQEVTQAGGAVKCLSNTDLPLYQGKRIRDNIYILGGILQSTRLKEIISKDDVVKAVTEKWPKVAESNVFAIEKGMHSEIKTAL
ncbi:2-oxoacid:acceptor oxidoreductase family protein [Pectinatus haikarae]|uniref:Indolepyruvate ferredoxin oxidoreductase beta subunit n=1 Tax=Pectinatus haikarae TaxID=349096 RepID=A0ABT9YAE0_9FIRM|nr:2-oxoacid:acceptor oxidoreductase family protein [Pectinatus haikarae]MDQ0204782.1 indolepyruvate ferredoxin oxidoreductase beta subunit [Pectinatus haikarae]